MTATTTEQSKKLIELGIDPSTADRCYLDDGTAEKLCLATYKGAVKVWGKYYAMITPAWSFTALTGLLKPCTIDESADGHYRIFSHDRFSEWYENPIDACVELLVKLKTK